jgi:acyl carrier protein
MSELVEKYQNAFLEAFELSDKSNLRDLKYQSIDEWDSIGHMALIAELESAYGITIKTEDLIEFESYTQGVDILARYGIIVEI